LSCKPLTDYKRQSIRKDIEASERKTHKRWSL